MAKFSEVFSITAKVIGALLLISLLIALVTGTLGVLIQGFYSQRSAAAAHVPRDTTHETEVNEFRSTMRQSMWDRAVRRAIGWHCYFRYFRGMNKQEVIQALGEPKNKLADTWFYHRAIAANAKCLKYSGDNCVQRESPSVMWVSFTEAGFVDEALDQCQAVNGDYVYNKDLFREEVAAAAREKLPDSLRAKTEAEAQSWQTQKFCEANGFVWKDDGCHLQAIILRR